MSFIMATRKARKAVASIPAPDFEPEADAVERAALEARIRERAYELFIESGGEHGHDAEHWLQAEREILAAQAAD